jgi:hypothetical protein
MGSDGDVVRTHFGHTRRRRVLGDRTTPAELDHYRPDLLMAIATPGGKERTRGEFEALFDAVGFRLAAVVPTRSPMSVIEAVAR